MTFLTAHCVLASVLTAFKAAFTLSGEATGLENLDSHSGECARVRHSHYGGGRVESDSQSAIPRSKSQDLTTHISSTINHEREAWINLQEGASQLVCACQYIYACTRACITSMN